MSRLTTIRPEFVEFIPKDLEDGVLYVSIPYSTSVHRCACGCGSKITLPINRAKWRFLWDGEAISFWPSVGNWSYPCQSHYWIEENRIQWASKMSREKIDANRARDKADRERYVRSRTEPEQVQPSAMDTRRGGLIDRVRGLFRR
jgi:hypothetical protein